MRKKYLVAGMTAVILLLSACSTSNDNVSARSVVKIDYNEYRQEIDGFGGSNAWTRLPGNEKLASDLVKLLYCKNEGIGLTILRNRIPFRERLPGDDNAGLNDGFIMRNSDHSYAYTEDSDGVKTFGLNWNSWDIASTRNLIRQIQNLGSSGPEKLVIMSSPWTTPNNRVTRWKEDVRGVSSRLDYAIDWSKPDIWGRLKRQHYNDYADLLADYVKNFESQMGAPLDILSVQNEPNWKVEYESAYWSGLDLRDFIKTISERFPKKGLTPGENGIGIMMPEFENFDINFNDMIKPSLDDPASQRAITHIALHQYNAGFDMSTRAGAKEFPGIIESGKRFWQTEIGTSGPHAPTGSGINNALYFARMIHWDLTLVQMNAFLFWWLWFNTEDDSFGGSLVTCSDREIKPALRLYAMGQYSRFIRPGWHRIECDASPLWGVFSSAYRNPKTNEIAIVIINERHTESSISIDLNGAEFERLDTFRTSENERLKSIGRQRTSRNTANVTLPPMSITTYYGRVK
ncbi:MAG: hypothetical protein FWD40_06145 [Treponema sp.]|nr:hypothetical protein [Treponema sp.]